MAPHRCAAARGDIPAASEAHSVNRMQHYGRTFALKPAQAAPAAGQRPADVIEADSSDYARLIGERLRAIRRQRGWSLRDAADASGSQFSPSAIGTYERGERGLSIERLHRLALLYRVPVDRLLPEDQGSMRSDDDGAGPAEDIVIDLTALEAHRAEPALDALQR